MFNFFRKKKNNNEDMMQGLGKMAREFSDQDIAKMEIENAVRKLYFLAIEKLELEKGEQYEELLVYHFLSKKNITMPVFFFEKFTEQQLKDFIEIFKENDYEEKDIISMLEDVGSGNSLAKGFERLLKRASGGDKGLIDASVSAGHTVLDVAELFKGSGYSLFDFVRIYKDAGLLIGERRDEKRSSTLLMGMGWGDEETYALIQIMDIYEDACQKRKAILEKAKKDTESLGKMVEMLKEEGFDEGHILLNFKEAYSKEETLEIFEENGFPISKKKIKEVFETKYGDNWEAEQIKLIEHTIPRAQKRKKFIEKLNKKDELFSDIGVVLRRKASKGGRIFGGVYDYSADIV